MGRNFKMFDHLSDPEMRFRIKEFVFNKPLEAFLISSFIYLIFGWFSYRSLLGAYIGLICFSFVQQYKQYYMDKVFDYVYKNVVTFIMAERNKMVMAPYMKAEDIDDGNEEDDEASEGDNVAEGDGDGSEEKSQDIQNDSELLPTFNDSLQADDVKTDSEINWMCENVSSFHVPEETQTIGGIDQEEDSITEENYLSLRKRQIPRT